MGVNYLQVHYLQTISYATRTVEWQVSREYETR